MQHQQLFQKADQFKAQLKKDLGIDVEYDGKPNGPASYAWQLPVDPGERARLKAAVEAKFAVEEVEVMDVDASAPSQPEGKGYVVKIDLIANSLLGHLRGRAVRDAVLGSLSPMPAGAVLGHAVVIGGKTLKVHLSDVTLAAWDDLHKKLQAHGYVHVLAGEALQEQRKRDEVTRASKMRRAEMLSDVESMLAGMRELAELHGVGGKGTKRHRFARVLGRCLDRSSRVAAYNLREAEEENPDLSDDAD